MVKQSEGFERRFGGVGRLLSREGLEQLRKAHVCVVGLGGVGSWVVEALARSGLGELTLVDLDDVCISNVNRQLHAVQSELGKPKVEAMQRRVQAINPECTVHGLQSFFLKSNAAQILSEPYHYVVDAIDSPSLKALLIAKCKEKGISVITTGGAGGRRDPTSVRVTDLAYTTGDRLLRYVRSLLRKTYGFPRGDGTFGIECVYSAEEVVYPEGERAGCRRAQGENPDLRLDCDTGFGTACFVTGTFGFAAAARVVKGITGAKAELHSGLAIRLSDQFETETALQRAAGLNCAQARTTAPNTALKLASTLAASSDSSTLSNSEAKA